MFPAATPPRARAVNYTGLANFRYEIRRFLRVSEEAARAEGLEPQQHQLLLALKGAPARSVPTIAFLAERLQLQHHSVVGLVDRLVERRMVARRRDSSDHRRVLVSLTAEGEEVLHRLSVLHQAEIRSRARELISAMVSIVKSSASGGKRRA
jgi:DNA-binding MarR family transcriptional regulator